MDLFYSNATTAGTLRLVTLPEIQGIANMVVFDKDGAKTNAATFLDSVMLQSLTWSQEANTQFQQSLDNVIYLYAFGDRMGDLTVTGLTFRGQCGNGGNSSNSGLANLIKYYKDKRASQTLQEIKISLATEVIRGYLVGLVVNTFDVSTGIFQFVMRLKTIPAAFRTGA